eukprot:scaffold2235_cov167-Amphora_coffeaeformis.AAC.3
MSHRQLDDTVDEQAPLTLEEAYLVFDRLNPFHASGVPTIATIKRLRGQPHARKMFYGRQTLLHKCCCEGFSDRLDLIRALVETYPEAVELYDQDGFFPLHHVVSPGRQGSARQVNTAVVEYLIQQGPLALLQTTRNERRAIPLHLAVENPAVTVELLKLLLQVFPETIHYRDGNGCVPVEYAIQTLGVSMEVIKYVVNASPVLLSFVKDGSLVLHRYLQQLEPVDDDGMSAISSPSTLRAATVLNILVQACPGALRVQTQRRQTPLVLACEANVAVPCLYTLVRAWPEQVTTQRNLILEDDEWNGVWLPTHLLQENLSWRHVPFWLESDPRAATTPDAAGRLALHYAVLTQASCAVPLVRTLLQSHLAALQHADKWGRLPIHYLSLSTHRHRDELLQLILDVDKAGLETGDDEGCLPWMYAELVHFTAVYEASLAQGIALDHTEDLPTEVRWDIVQVVTEEDEYNS